VVEVVGVLSAGIVEVTNPTGKSDGFPNQAFLRHLGCAQVAISAGLFLALQG